MMEFDIASMVPFIIVGFVAFFIGNFVYYMLTRKPKSRYLAKDQYDRELGDHMISGRMNRRSAPKWVNFTGDTFVKPIKHFAKIWAWNPDGRMIEFIIHNGFGTSKRLFLCPHDLVDKLSGREVWIKANGIHKIGIFLSPLISRETRNYDIYDRLIQEYIKIHMSMQSNFDMIEQGYYSALYATTVEAERRPEAIIGKKEEPTIVEEEVEYVEEPR